MLKIGTLLVVTLIASGCSQVKLSASPKTYGLYYPINKNIPERPTSIARNTLDDKNVEK